jgi:hypothetical protein
MAHIIATKKTETASISVARLGDSVVVSAYLLASNGQPDFDLGQLACQECANVFEAHGVFAALVGQIESLEAAGSLGNELAFRQLRDYAARDRMGLVT